jgi:hypothetical protein
MRERRTYGFVRGVLGDWHPYRARRVYIARFSDAFWLTRRERYARPTELRARLPKLDVDERELLRQAKSGAGAHGHAPR